MQCRLLLTVCTLLTSISFASCANINRAPLSYASVNQTLWVPSVSSNVTTLLDFIKSRSELSTLLSVLSEPAGQGNMYSKVGLEKLQLMFLQGFSKPSIPHPIHGHSLSSRHRTRRSTTLDLTFRPSLRRQRVNGGWAIS